MEHIEESGPNGPMIIGGDFNAPQGDAIFRLLASRLQDTFRTRGHGWGNTIINDFAVLRIDQIWISPEYETVRVIARRTVHSDHRMVIADLKTATGAKAP